MISTTDRSHKRVELVLSSAVQVDNNMTLRDQTLGRMIIQALRTSLMLCLRNLAFAEGEGFFWRRVMQ